MSSVSRKKIVEKESPMNAQKQGTAYDVNPQIAPHTSPIPMDNGEKAVNTPVKAVWPSPKVEKRGTGPL